MSRPSWTKYFLDIATLVATRSTCLRAHHGAVLVRDKQILSTGYNGAPSGVPHCVVCNRAKQGCLPGQRYELCLSGETTVKLLNGTYETIAELAKTPDQELWVYAVDRETGEIVPARAHNPRKTGIRCLVEVRLDNDATFRCTHDHLVLMRDGSYKEAGRLSYGDSLMPMYYNFATNKGYESISNTVKVRKEGKSRVWLNEFAGRTRTTPTHKLVDRHINGLVPPGDLIHHKNENITDNTPKNLVRVPRGVHTKKHLTGRVVSECTREKISDSGKKAQAKLRENPLFVAEQSARGAKNMAKNWADKEFRAKTSERSRVLGKSLAAKTNSVPAVIISRRRGNVLAGISRVLFESKGIVGPDNYAVMRGLYTLKHRLGEAGPQAPTVEAILSVFPSLTEAFKSAKTYNHKVMNVSQIDGLHEVYDLTVPMYENFAISAGEGSCVFVHNCTSVHSEANAIAQAARNGVRTDGATLYVTGPPCKMCSRLIISAGIKEVVFPFGGRYKFEDTGIEILQSAGVEVRDETM